MGKLESPSFLHLEFHSDPQKDIILTKTSDLAEHESSAQKFITLRILHRGGGDQSEANLVIE